MNRLRDEEVIEVWSYCEFCDNTRLAEILEGEFVSTCECGGDLVRA